MLVARRVIGMIVKRKKNLLMLLFVTPTRYLVFLTATFLVVSLPMLQSFLVLLRAKMLNKTNTDNSGLFVVLPVTESFQQSILKPAMGTRAAAAGLMATKATCRSIRNRN